MTTLERLQQWRRAGTITDAQHETLSALVRKAWFSVFFELNALLYLGVLLLAGGLGWTFRTHSTSLGDAFILVTLSLLLAGSLYYCFSRAPGYSTEEVESPNFVVDYVLYLASLILSVELGYIEFRFEWLREAWDNYLLFSSAVFFGLAYRFDNRFVLSLALSSLAGWCGVRVSRAGFMSAETLRVSALAYGSVIAVIGTFLYRRGIKKHFLETYLHIAANVIFIALVSGLSGSAEFIHLSALVLSVATAVILGVWLRRFMFVVYGTVFGYIGLSTEVLRGVREFSAVLTYFVVTGTGVIMLIVLLARRWGREE